MSIDLPGQNWIVMFAIVGPGFLVVGDFKIHLPGVRRVEGLCLSIERSSLLSGLTTERDPK